MLWFSEKRFNRLKQASGTVKGELVERVSGYILAAFGLVAGLAWNEAIKGLIEYLFPLNKNSIPAKFIYAVVMTMIVVIVTLYTMRLIRRSKT